MIMWDGSAFPDQTAKEQTYLGFCFFQTGTDIQEGKQHRVTYPVKFTR